MKKYKVSLFPKILSIITALLIILGIILAIFDSSAPLIVKIMVPFGLLLTIVGLHIVYKIQIITDNEKITIHPIKFIPKTGILYWNEITELRSEYFLWPEQGLIKLIPDNKRFLRFCIWGMPIELLKDIILHLPSDAKIELYTYLERKLEGKQTWFFKRQEYHTRKAAYWHNIWKEFQ